MSKTFLIYNSNSKNRLEKIKELSPENFKFENNPDYLHIERSTTKKSIGIEEVKILGQFLQTRPLSNKVKIAHVSNFSSLTTEAQNSLLKILEEHSDLSIIFLEDDYIFDVLPTIISRCMLIKVEGESEETEKNENFPENFFELSITEKLNWLDKTGKISKEEMINLLHQIMSQLRQEKYQKFKNENKFNLDLITQTCENLGKYNLNTKLIVENLVLNLKVIVL